MHRKALFCMFVFMFRATCHQSTWDDGNSALWRIVNGYRGGSISKYRYLLPLNAFDQTPVHVGTAISWCFPIKAAPLGWVTKSSLLRKEGKSNSMMPYWPFPLEMMEVGPRIDVSMKSKFLSIWDLIFACHEQLFDKLNRKTPSSDFIASFWALSDLRGNCFHI